MQYLLKSIVFASVCCVTWLGTNQLMAQFQRGSPAPQEVAVPPQRTLPREEGRTVVRPAGGRAAKPQQAASGFPQGEQPVASYRLASCKVRVLDGNALVDATVEMLDNHAIKSYLWRLSFLDGEDRMIEHKLYPDDLFKLQRGVVTRPKFQEVASMPAGAKLVQLSLFALDAGTDVRIFEDDKEAQGYLILRGVRSVAE